MRFSEGFYAIAFVVLFVLWVWAIAVCIGGPGGIWDAR
jgi:hypothetical protein